MVEPSPQAGSIGVSRQAITKLVRLHRVTHDFSLRVIHGLIWPYHDLSIRLLLAGLFVTSGFLKITNWPVALELARTEYPVSWLSAVAAAHIGVSIELIGGVLLALGLLTRYAALALFALTLVIQFAYLPFDHQLYWAALLGWYMLSGAGPLSIDYVLRRGLAESAVPVLPSLARGGQWLRANLCSPYLAALRVWLGAALIVGTFLPDSPLDLWLPIRGMQLQNIVLGFFSGCAMLAGFATRYVAAALFVTFLTSAMMHSEMAQQIFGVALLTLPVADGGGKPSADAWVDRWLTRRLPELDGRLTFELESVPRIVIVGAGFGGIACATALRNVRASVTIIDRGNHHLFQPLLYQVATAALSPSDIASPIRPMFRGALNTRVFFGAVEAIDTVGGVVQMAQRSVPYDFLVVATGAAHSYFGKDEWAAFAPGLKRIEDATRIRSRILTAFERAEATQDEEDRAALLTFLIVGGGPTGVELAGAIAELARFGMDQDFRAFDPAKARVILVQSASRILPTFPQDLAQRAHRSLEKMGVEVMLQSRVDLIDAMGVTVGVNRIATRTVLWAAGVMASPAAQWLKVDADAAGRIRVADDLTVPTLANVFAIGDTALSASWHGKAAPGLAPAAKQGGIYAASVIKSRIEGKRPPKPFVYRHRGTLAAIGRKAAVADFGVMKLWGAPAWWLWGLVHLGFLVGIRSRMSTMMNWFWAYITYNGGVRLITHVQPEFVSVCPADDQSLALVVPAPTSVP